MSGRPPTYSEPDLHDLLADPLIRTIMAADGIDERELRELFDQATRASREPLPAPTEALTGADGLRRGVGILLINFTGQVFVGQRSDMTEEAWQMPQGGIEPGETAQAAALRELREELGTANAEVVARTNDWLSYELPAEILDRIPMPRGRGQVQRWFLLRFLGNDSEIDVATEHPEFSSWKWLGAHELPTVVAPFKRELYRRVLVEFAPYLP